MKRNTGNCWNGQNPWMKTRKRRLKMVDAAIFGMPDAKPRFRQEVLVECTKLLYRAWLLSPSEVEIVFKRMNVPYMILINEKMERRD